MLSEPLFPLFRQRFLQAPLNTSLVETGKATADAQQEPSSVGRRVLLTMDSALVGVVASHALQQTVPGLAPQSQHQLQRPNNLRTLDLRGLQRDDGPPSETQLRRQKYQFFDKHCSEVWDRLFLSGDTVARSRETLQVHGVTHVVNCVGFVLKEYFKDELVYKTYFLQDTPAEDILCVLYDAFEFIDQALQQGGRVLVHCSQGVSRSATVVIAYLMWLTGGTYDDVFAQVKSVRGVANPNIGFTCQLLQWQKRQRSPAAKSRMYRMGPHCHHSPTFLVPRLITPPEQYETHTWRQLDPRGSFIIQSPSQVYVWVGAQCPEPMAAAAVAWARLLIKYEVTGVQEARVCRQGGEPADLVALMDPPALDPDAKRHNARRASITGELYGQLESGLSLDAHEDAMSPSIDSNTVASPQLSALEEPPAQRWLQRWPPHSLEQATLFDQGGGGGANGMHADTPMCNPDGHSSHPSLQIRLRPLLQQQTPHYQQHGEKIQHFPPPLALPPESIQPGFVSGGLLTGSAAGSGGAQATSHSEGPAPHGLLSPVVVSPAVSTPPLSAAAVLSRGADTGLGPPAAFAGRVGGSMVERSWGGCKTPSGASSSMLHVPLPLSHPQLNFPDSITLAPPAPAHQLQTPMPLQPLQPPLPMPTPAPPPPTRPATAQHVWGVTPVEDYAADYQQYAEALREQHAVTPGSDEAVALALAGSRDRVRDLRLSMTGTELMPGGRGAVATGAVGFLQQPLHGAKVEGAPLGVAVGPLGPATLAMQLGLLGGRPDSPAAAEGRLKKYRRGGTAKMAALGQEKSQRMFLSLHQSMDDVDMP